MIDAARQTWPAFVLVAGLLLVGAVAEADGLFAAVGARLARLPGGPRVLLLALLGLVAVVTAVLNLDTSVVFLTPVLIHAARQRGTDERAFLYGAVFMSNAASLVLPGSNLTNLIVLANEHVAGATYAARTLPASLTAIAVTAVVVLIVFRSRAAEPVSGDAPPLRLGLGVVATLGAAALVLTLSAPALPVLGVGIAAVALRRVRPRLDVRVLGSLFVLAVALGTLARHWSGPGDLIEGASRWSTAGIGALAAVLVNNLPAAALLSAQAPHHARALLIGLDLGPNLAVTGSLSAYLWLRAARAVGAEPSLRTYSLVGLALVPLSVAVSLAAISL